MKPYFCFFFTYYFCSFTFANPYSNPSTNFQDSYSVVLLLLLGYNITILLPTLILVLKLHWVTPQMGEFHIGQFPSTQFTSRCKIQLHSWRKLLRDLFWGTNTGQHWEIIDLHFSAGRNHNRKSMIMLGRCCYIGMQEFTNKSVHQFSAPSWPNLTTVTKKGRNSTL